MSKLSLRIDFERPGAIVGPGKIRLLEEIARTGSIAAAGRSMAMSYRRAWLLVDTLNRIFGRPVVESVPGGRGGGGAVLTPLGQRLVAGYREIEQAATEAAAAALAALEAELPL